LTSPDLADRAAVEALLFDAFIPAAYRRHPAGRWTAQRAETWLVFLASHLERTIGVPDLAWWQVRRAVSGDAYGLTVVAGTAVVGLAAWITGVLAAGASLITVLVTAEIATVAYFAYGGAYIIVGGLVLAGFWVRRKLGHPYDESAEPRFGFGSAGTPARGLGIGSYGLGLTYGLAAGLGIGVLAWYSAGLTAALLAGTAAGLAVGLFRALKSVAGDLATATSPGVMLARDRQVALLIMLVCGFTAGFAAGCLTGLTAVGVHAAGAVGSNPAVAVGIGLAYGLGTGLVVGLGLGLTQTAWPSYTLVRGWLALHHRLPWKLMSFLADAHERGVLRQAGAVYQFRHIELQHRLANRDANKQEANASAVPAAADE
jgi:hypothetical protein